MKLGQRLKELRTTCGLSLDEATFTADVSRTQLVAYEQSRPGNNPRFETMLRLAKAYGVTEA